MNISQEVKLILDQNLVTHGQLKLNALSRSKHHAVTDYNKVYVKVLKPGTSFSYASMLQTEIDFAFNTGYGTIPLLENAIHKNSRGRSVILSAWEYEQQIPITQNLNPIQVAQAAAELYKIHSLEKYPTLRVNADEEFREYGTYLTSHSFNFLSANHQNLIKRLYRDVIQPVTESLTINPQINVVSHGEAILEKVVARPSAVQWVDYESVRSAPREYDAARMLLQLHYRLGRPDLWELFKDQYELRLGRPLNSGMLEEYSSLHLARRGLKLASTSLHTLNQETLLPFLKEINDLVSGKTNLANMGVQYLS